MDRRGRRFKSNYCSNSPAIGSCLFMPPTKQARKEPIVPQMLLSRFEVELRGKKTQSSYESWLSQIEGDAVPVLEAIIAQSLLTRAWHTIEAPPDHCFAISDCPVVTDEVRGGQPYPGAGFGGKNTAVLLPVGPQHLFVASPHHFKMEPRCIAFRSKKYKSIDRPVCTPERVCEL
jgi:hypothetical protein